MLSGWLLEDKENTLSDESKENLQLLVERTQSMNQMISDILTYASTGEVNLPNEEINVDKLLDEIINAINAPEHIQIMGSCAPHVHYPRIQLMQIFQNLIDNAIKYMDKPKGRIEIGCKKNGKFWEFYVKDNGPGIPPEYHKDIFKMFQTVPCQTAKKDSTGIGLAIVRKIVKANGGDIWVESEQGKGSTFYFTIPKD